MLLIRPARPDDADALWRVFTTSVRELARSHYSPAQIDSWSGAGRPAGFHVPIAHKRILVAELEGVPVGFLELVPDEEEIRMLYVGPDYVRRGVGTALVAAAEVSARRQGLTRLHLRASLNAVPFYERVGFTQIQQVLHRSADGTEYLCALMEKSIVP